MSRLLQRVYRHRGITDVKQLDTSLPALLDPALLSHMDAATALLETALRGQQRILVVGDFDADGATRTALCLRALRALGAGEVHYLVPNRFEYGYGLTPEIVAVAAQWKPDLIMTVDNGIASIDGVAVARELGIEVLVTDHHLPGEQLPAAAAIVNPNLPGDPFPSKSLAGVGVAFYVMLALRARLRKYGWFKESGRPEPNFAELLDLVALGTVADVVPLDRNNRILVAQGLKRIAAGRCVPGILALLKLAGRDHRHVVASDLGFVVGPRLNAAGRLEDMSVGIECLLRDDEDSALALATQLDQLNRERRDIEADMKQEAAQILESLHNEQQDLPLGICLYQADWHQGVIGILAARVKELWHRPVIVFASSSEQELKGSARSVRGIHIRDVLDTVASRHPGLINKFGGHAMAAGLSLRPENLDKFEQALQEVLGQLVSPEQLQGIIESDGALRAEEFSLDSARELREASPWGQGFPEPVFDNEFEVVGSRVVGGHHLKLQLRPEGMGLCIDAIAFNPDDLSLGAGERIRAAYKLDINRFRGATSLQLLVDHIQRI